MQHLFHHVNIGLDQPPFLSISFDICLGNIFPFIKWLHHLSFGIHFLLFAFAFYSITKYAIGIKNVICLNNSSTNHPSKIIKLRHLH